MADVPISGLPVASAWGTAYPFPVVEGGITKRATLGLAIGVGVEAWAGNPSSNGQVLSSTTAGVRSWITPNAGTVTNFSSGDLPPLFTTTESTTTTTPALSFALSNAAINTVFGYAGSSSSGAPTFTSAPRFLQIANLTSDGFVKVGSGNGTLSVDTAIYLASVNTDASLIGNGTSGSPLGLDKTVDLALTQSQTITRTDATVNDGAAVLSLRHNTTGTPAIGLGADLYFGAQTSTTLNQTLGLLRYKWSTITDASRTSYMQFWLVGNAVLNAFMTLFGSGGLALGPGAQADPGAGYVNAAAGFKIGGTDIFPLTTARGGVPSGGTAGQILQKNSATNFDYAWGSYTATQTATASTTAGTTNTAGIMAGLGSGASFSPHITGRALVILTGYFTSSVANNFVAVASLKYGTGTAPVHGAAITGTTIAQAQAWGTSSTAGASVPFSATGIVTGLTIGTTYWFDAVYGTSGASSTAKLNACGFSIVEF